MKATERDFPFARDAQWYLRLDGCRTTSHFSHVFASLPQLQHAAASIWWSSLISSVFLTKCSVPVFLAVNLVAPLLGSDTPRRRPNRATCLCLQHDFHVNFWSCSVEWYKYLRNIQVLQQLVRVFFWSACRDRPNAHEHTYGRGSQPELIWTQSNWVFGFVN